VAISSPPGFDGNGGSSRDQRFRREREDAAGVASVATTDAAWRRRSAATVLSAAVALGCHEYFGVARVQAKSKYLPA